MSSSDLLVWLCKHPIPGPLFKCVEQQQINHTCVSGLKPPHLFNSQVAQPSRVSEEETDSDFDSSGKVTETERVQLLSQEMTDVCHSLLEYKPKKLQEKDLNILCLYVYTVYYFL